jgi:hypothetical protein
MTRTHEPELQPPPQAAAFPRLYEEYRQLGIKHALTGGALVICGASPQCDAMSAGYRAGYYSVPEAARHQAAQAALSAGREAGQ